MEPDVQSIAALGLVRFMDQYPDAVVERWSSRLASSMPELFALMTPAIWSNRLTDTFATFKAELATPETLTLPVFSRKTGSVRLLELGARAVHAHFVSEDLEPHEFQSAYFLLQQAILDTLDEYPVLPDQLAAFQLVDHFIKQLAVAMSIAVSVMRAQPQ